MKGAVVIDGQRIEIGDQVRVVRGPFAGHRAVYKGRSKQPDKLLIRTGSGCTATNIVLDRDSVEGLEPKS